MKSLTTDEFNEILKTPMTLVQTCTAVLANTPTRLGSYLTIYRGTGLGRRSEVYFVGVDLQTNKHVIELVG